MMGHSGGCLETRGCGEALGEFKGWEGETICIPYQTWNLRRFNRQKIL